MKQDCNGVPFRFRDYFTRLLSEKEFDDCRNNYSNLFHKWMIGIINQKELARLYRQQRGRK